MAKNKLSDAEKQIRSARNLLIRHKLYIPRNKSAPPTDYAKRLVRRLKPDIEAIRNKHAIVLKVPRGAVPEYRGVSRGSERRVIVTLSDIAANASYNRRTKEITQTGRLPDGSKVTFRRVPFDKIGELKNNQSYVVPFRRLGRKFDIKTFGDRDMLMRYIHEYTTPDADGEVRYKNMQDYIFIATRSR